LDEQNKALNFEWKDSQLFVVRVTEPQYIARKEGGISQSRAT